MTQRWLILLGLAGGLLCIEAAAQGRGAAPPHAEQRALNVFVSNFVEAGLEPFERGRLSNQARLRFGFLNTLINRQRYVQGDWNIRDGLRLSPERVAEPVARYFGLGVDRHEDIFDHGAVLARYRDGQYRFGWGDGEIYPFGHVIQLRDLGGGEAEAIVQMYQGEDDDYDPYATTEADWRRRGLSVHRLGRRRAVIRRVGGIRRVDVSPQYVLLSWGPLE